MIFGGIWLFFYLIVGSFIFSGTFLAARFAFKKTLGESFGWGVVAFMIIPILHFTIGAVRGAEAEANRFELERHIIGWNSWGDGPRQPVFDDERALKLWLAQADRREQDIVQQADPVEQVDQREHERRPHVHPDRPHPHVPSPPAERKHWLRRAGGVAMDFGYAVFSWPGRLLGIGEKLVLLPVFCLIVLVAGFVAVVYVFRK